jgi:hypothetical protein
MRHVRRFSFGALLVSAMMALSSCDYVLELFYPEFVAQGGASATIELDISLDNQVVADATANDAPIKISLIPKQESGSGGFAFDLSNAISKKSKDLSDNNVLEKFSGLRRANYVVLVWLDLNKDGRPDASEPGRVAKHKLSDLTDEYSKDFDFRDGGVTYLRSRMSLDSTDRIDDGMLAALETGTLQELDFDPYFWIDGAQIVDYASPLDASYQITYADPNAESNVTGVYWAVVDSLGNTGVNNASGNAGNPFQVNFSSTPGGFDSYEDIQIKVKVEYNNGHSEHSNFYLQAIQEPGAGAGYDLFVDVGLSDYSLTGPPIYLGSGQFNYQVVLFQSQNAFDWYNNSFDEAVPTLKINNGFVEEASFGPVFGGYVKAPHLDGAQVSLDSNANGIYGDAGDWVSNIKQIFKDTSSLEAYVYFDPYEFFPVN